MSLEDAIAALKSVAGLPLRLHRLELAPGARAWCGNRLGLSAYDGMYAALAESLDAPLVTADRQLAAAVPSAELLS